VVFTDAQMAALVRLGPLTLESLKKVEGIGPAKIERYGGRLLAALAIVPVPDVSGEAAGGGKR
jgi:hypothetical protein